MTFFQQVDAAFNLIVLTDTAQDLYKLHGDLIDSHQSQYSNINRFKRFVFRDSDSIESNFCGLFYSSWSAYEQMIEFTQQKSRDVFLIKTIVSIKQLSDDNHCEVTVRTTKRGLQRLFDDSLCLQEFAQVCKFIESQMAL